MARIVIAKQVRVGAEVTIVDGQPIFSGGHILKEVPTLYDANGNYVRSVNSRFLDLAEYHKDLSSDRKALCNYWTFLEREQLAWDDFSMPKNLKPTFRWRNGLKRAADDGEMAYSTANAYVCRMVGFYKHVMSNGMLRIHNETDVPFKFEWVKIARDGMSDQENYVIHVQTTDLRIPVPKNAENNKIRSLSPLEREEIRAMIQVMQKSPIELRLMVGLGCQSGLRLSEAATFSDKLVRKPMTGEKRIEIEIGPHVGVHTKYGKIRKVEVTANQMRALYNYSVSERRAKRVAKAGALGKHVPLFVNQRCTPYKIKSIMKQWGDIRKSVQKKYGIPFKHDFHDTRVEVAEVCETA